MANFLSEVDHCSNNIVLMDSSGSVVTDFGTTKKTVFETMCEKTGDIMNKNKVENFRIMFWNSENNNFPQGVMALPFFVTKERLIEVAKNLILPKITNTSLTHTWLSFDRLPREWLNHVDSFNIFLITDGELGHTGMNSIEKSNCQNKLSTSIKKLLDEYNNIQIHIIAVENINRNYENMTESTNIVGCDVFNCIQKESLTNKISSFISYSPNNPEGYVQFQNIRCPPGHAPFKQQYFHFSKLDLFYKHIKELIPTLNIEELYRLVNELSKTLQVITKDKTPEISNKIIESYCKLFDNSPIDIVLLKFMLLDTIERDRSGKAEIITEFRNRVRNLFKQAEELLCKNTKNAIGINGDKVMSLPLQLSEKESIIVCPAKMMHDNIFGQFNNSSIKINNKFIPMIPIKFYKSEMSDQCLRQWIRILVSKITKRHITDDTIIYIMLSKMVQVILSDIDEEIKIAYREICISMLNKKRLTEDITEYKYLQQGNIPTFNNNFEKGMMIALEFMNLKIKPYTYWYLICLALNNEKLIKNQAVHCVNDIKTDFPELDKLENLLIMIKPQIKTIDIINVPDEYNLEYKCIITLEDTSETGGYMIMSHFNKNGEYICSPNQVLSNDGYTTFIKSDHSLCPICYQELSENDFKQINKKANLDIKIPDNTVGCYNENINQIIEVIKPLPLNQKNKKRIIISMKGTIGSGKSTISMELHKQLTEVGIKSIIVSMDNYYKKGFDASQAGNMIKNDIIKFSQNDDDLLIIIMDMCNEKGPNLKNLFGINMTSWKNIIFWSNIYKQMKQITHEERMNYLSWTLYNVLNRGKSDGTTLYHLNPELFGMSKCIEVHKRKFEILFNLKKNQIELFATDPLNIDDAKNKLQDGYNKYNEYLKQFNLNEKITEFLKKNKIID